MVESRYAEIAGFQAKPRSASRSKRAEGGEMHSITSSDAEWKYWQADPRPHISYAPA
jgi:hypothetical protein